jgi:exonuclease SbcD
VIPVVRTRAAGISQEATIAAKIAVWARLTEARAEPLLACLEALQTRAPEEIAANIMERAIEAPGAIPAAAESDTDALAETTADAAALPLLVEAP